MTPSNLAEKSLSTSENIKSTYQVKNLDHLGLIAAQFDALGLVELIDNMIPAFRLKLSLLFSLEEPQFHTNCNCENVDRLNFSRNAGFLNVKKKESSLLDRLSKPW